MRGWAFLGIVAFFFLTVFQQPASPSTPTSGGSATQGTPLVDIPSVDDLLSQLQVEEAKAEKKEVEVVPIAVIEEEVAEEPEHIPEYVEEELDNAVLLLSGDTQDIPVSSLKELPAQVVNVVDVLLN